MSAFIQGVTSTKLGDLKYKQGVVCGCQTDTVDAAIQLLVDYGIRFLPLLDQPGGKVVSGVDVSDISSYLVEVLASDLPTKVHAGELAAIDLALKEPVSKAIGKSGLNDFCTLAEDKTIGDAIPLLLGNVKRIVVVDSKTGAPSSVFSRGMCMKQISDQLKKSPLEPMTIDEVKIGRSPVVQMKHSEPFIEALKLMHRSKSSSVCVLNDMGTLIGVLSTSDVKLLCHNHKSRTDILQSSLHEALLVKDSGYEQAMFPYIHCKPITTVGLCADRLAATGVHRLFIVDPKDNPVAVLGLQDVLKLLWNYQ